MLIPSYIAIVSIVLFYAVQIIPTALTIFDGKNSKHNDALVSFDYIAEAVTGNLCGLSLVYYQIAKLYYAFLSSHYEISQTNLFILMVCYIIQLMLRFTFFVLYYVVYTKKLLIIATIIYIQNIIDHTIY